MAMNVKTKLILTVVVTAVVCLAIGYFGGRIYLKHQIKTTLQQAFAGLSSPTTTAGVSDSSSDVGPKADNAKSETPPPVLQQPLTVALVKKGFIPKDIYNERFDSYITLSLDFTNATNKDIRAFDGTITFTDLLGNKILASRVEINKAVNRGKTLKWQGSIDYNQFNDSHKRLRSEPSKNLRNI